MIVSAGGVNPPKVQGVYLRESPADFYAHSPKKVRKLMERSALVIIDFEQAIENGFVRLATNLSKLANMDENE